MGKLNASVETTTKLSTANIRTEAQKAVATGIKAGELTEEGFMFQFMGLEKKTGKHGDFFILSGLDMNGELVEVLTSSKLLVQMVNENYATLVNKIINLSGEGQGYERTYLIDIISPGNIKPKVNPETEMKE